MQSVDQKIQNSILFLENPSILCSHIYLFIIQIIYQIVKILSSKLQNKLLLKVSDSLL